MLVTEKAEEERFQVRGQPGLNTETLCQNALL
jgi:hypothetical protein